MDIQYPSSSQPLGFKKIEKGEWKGRGFGRFELDFYHDDKQVAIECDGSIHNKDGALERDVRKNQKCQELGITLYRLRDPYLTVLNDGMSVNYILDRTKRVKSNLLIDCKQELENILHTHGIVCDQDYIDFERDIDDIFDNYKELYVNNRGSKYVGQKAFCKSSNQNITLINYHNSRNVDVVFDDGQRVNGVLLSSFKKGAVMHPELTRSDIAREIANRNESLISKRRAQSAEQAMLRLNEKIVTNSGLEAEIIEYRSTDDVTVRFSIDGSTARVKYYNFKKGAIQHPSLSTAAIAQQRLHEKSITKDGYEIEIVKYNNCHDIDVLFVDCGLIRCGMSYSCFTNGEIAHPYSLPENRLGRTFVTKQGYEVKVIAYRSCHDSDILFTIDGTIKSGVKYSDVEKGRTKHPTRDPLAEKRLGQSIITNEGHEIEIVAYRNATDLDVLFVKDGVYRYNVRYAEFKAGSIAHPNTKRKRK